MATRGFTGKLLLGITGKYTFAQTSAGESGETGTIDIGERYAENFSAGTAANQAQRCWESRGRTLTSGNTEDIDVYDFGSIDIGGGAGKDAFGQAMALTSVKAFYVKNLSSSAGTLTFGGKGTAAAWDSFFGATANNAYDSFINLAPGAGFGYINPNANGLTVTDTSNHLLTIGASGGNITYDIVIIGE